MFCEWETVGKVEGRNRAKRARSSEWNEEYHARGKHACMHALYAHNRIRYYVRRQSRSRRHDLSLSLLTPILPRQVLHPSIHPCIHSIRPRQIPQIPINQPPADLGLGDMNEIALHRIIEIVRIDDITIEQGALGPADLSAALLVDEQPGAQFLGLEFEEAGQLLQVHGGVEFEVGFDGGVPHGVLDLLHEDGEVVVDGVDVEVRVFEVGRGRADEFGAGGAEEVFEQGQGVGPAALEPVELVAVFVAQGGVDGVVEPGRAEADADGDEAVHLVVLLRDAVVLRRFRQVLGPRHVHEDVAEHADRVGVAPHHHVREADVVVRREVRGHDAREHGFLVQLDVVECLQRQAEVAEQTMDAEQTDDGEVAQHAIERSGPVLAGYRHGVFVSFHNRKLFVDLRALDKGI